MKYRYFALLLPLAGLIPGAAQARTRDDVMSGAFRCAAIGDGRQWLDCYYGAAQPLRAQLGLAPASQAQIRLVAAPPAGGNLPPQQQRARDAVMDGAFRCTAAADDRRWLDCYYAAAQPVRGQLGLPPAPQAPPHPPASPASAGNTMPERQFGLGAPALRQTADHIVQRMVSYKFDAAGIFTLTLADGQVWRQIEGDTAFANLKGRADAYTVTIKRGFFGSYNMTISKVPGLFRARRIS